MATYIALIHGEAGAYGIAFPDLPAAPRAARPSTRRLRMCTKPPPDWVEAMAAQGNDIPAPRPIETLRADPNLPTTSRIW